MSLCAKCSSPAFQRCSRCSAASYCSRDCQATHWSVHKSSCSSSSSKVPSSKTAASAQRKAPPTAKQAAAAALELERGIGEMSLEAAMKEVEEAKRVVREMQEKAKKATEEYENLQQEQKRQAKKVDEAAKLIAGESDKAAVPAAAAATTISSSPSSYIPNSTSFTNLLSIFHSVLPRSSSSSPRSFADLSCEGDLTVLRELLNAGLISAGAGFDVSKSNVERMKTVVAATTSFKSSSNSKLSAISLYELDFAAQSFSFPCPTNSFDVALDKCHFDYLLSSGVDSASSTLALQRARRFLTCILSTVLRPSSPLLLLTNLPPAMALPILSTASTDVAMIAAFDPKVVDVDPDARVSLGAGVAAISPSFNDIDKAPNPAAIMLHVYKLMSPATKLESGKAAVEKLLGEVSDAMQEVSDVKKQHALRVQNAESEVKKAKDKTGFAEKEKALDDAGADFRQAVQNEMAVAADSEKAAESVRSLTEVALERRHDKAISAYARTKGVEMQGEAPVRNSASVKVGSWGQSSEDVTLWLNVPRPEQTKLKVQDITVKFLTDALVVSVAPPIESCEPGCEPNEEELEFLEAFRFELSKNLFGKIDPSESSWSVAGNELCVTLAKRSPRDVWKTLGSDDRGEDDIKFRDYEKLARHLDGTEGEDDSKDVGTSTSANDGAPIQRFIEGSIFITGNSSNSVTLQVAISRVASKSSIPFSEVEADYLMKDYFVLCDSACSDIGTTNDYIFFNYVMDSDLNTTNQLVGSAAVPIQEHLLNLTEANAPGSNNLRSSGRLECRLVCGATKDVLCRALIPPFGSPRSASSSTLSSTNDLDYFFVNKKFSVLVEKQTFLQTFAVHITSRSGVPGSLPYASDLSLKMSPLPRRFGSSQSWTLVTLASLVPSSSTTQGVVIPVFTIAFPAPLSPSGVSVTESRVVGSEAPSDCISLRLQRCTAPFETPSTAAAATTTSSSSRPSSFVGDLLRDDSDDNDISQDAVATTPSDLSDLRCRFCSHLLLREESRASSAPGAQSPPPSSITSVLPLPSDYWDAVADYISCTPSFCSELSRDAASAERGRALEDSTSLLLHGDDCGERVSVMQVPGYGEDETLSLKVALAKALSGGEGAGGGGAGDGDEGGDAEEEVFDSVQFRGERKWRAGGRAVCCSRCCSVLGFAPEESRPTLRLYKHRLAAGKEEAEQEEVSLRGGPDGGQPTRSSVVGGVMSRHSVSSFVASEMVRYATVQAVFTFVLCCGGRREETIALRLLSWDNKLLVPPGKVGKKDERRDGGAADLELPRMVPVVKFLWSEGKRASGSDASRSSSVSASQNPFEWLDNCCPPLPPSRRSSPSPFSVPSPPRPTAPAATAPSAGAAVLLHLDAAEWDEVRAAILRGGGAFPKAVAEDVARGAKGGGGGEVGLSVLATVGRSVDLPFLNC